MALYVPPYGTKPSSEPLEKFPISADVIKRVTDLAIEQGHPTIDSQVEEWGKQQSPKNHQNDDEVVELTDGGDNRDNIENTPDDTDKDEGEEDVEPKYTLDIDSHTSPILEQNEDEID